MWVRSNNSKEEVLTLKIFGKHDRIVVAGFDYNRGEFIHLPVNKFFLVEQATEIPMLLRFSADARFHAVMARYGLDTQTYTTFFGVELVQNGLTARYRHLLWVEIRRVATNHEGLERYMQDCRPKHLKSGEWPSDMTEREKRLVRASMDRHHFHADISLSSADLSI